MIPSYRLMGVAPVKRSHASARKSVVVQVDLDCLEKTFTLCLIKSPGFVDKMTSVTPIEPGQEPGWSFVNGAHNGPWIIDSAPDVPTLYRELSEGINHEFRYKHDESTNWLSKPH